MSSGRRGRGSDIGFTLVEVLIATVLVGVLSAGVIVSAGRFTNVAGASPCDNSARAATTGSVSFFTAHGTYPTTLGEMVHAAPPTLWLPPGVSLVVSSASGNAGRTVASGQGWTVTMTAGAPGAAPTFTCTTS